MTKMYVPLSAGLICALALTGCNLFLKPVPLKGDDGYQPAYSVVVLSEKLRVAYKMHSDDSLRRFFSDWNQLVPSNTKQFIEQNDTIQAVFDVFRACYKPLDLLKLGDWEWGNKLNSGARYVVVQNKIGYGVVRVDSLFDIAWPRIPLDSVVNFRPPVDLDAGKVLFLTAEYIKALNGFLGSESTELGDPDIMSPSRAAGESEKRYDFIRPYIPILHGHWGGYWHLATHPSIGEILFNRTLTEARVAFRVGYQGGSAKMVRGADGWKIKESRSTWIE